MRPGSAVLVVFALAAGGVAAQAQGSPIQSVAIGTLNPGAALYVSASHEGDPRATSDPLPVVPDPHDLDADTCATLSPVAPECTGVYAGLHGHSAHAQEEYWLVLLPLAPHRGSGFVETQLDWDTGGSSAVGVMWDETGQAVLYFRGWGGTTATLRGVQSPGNQILAWHHVSAPG